MFGKGEVEDALAKAAKVAKSVEGSQNYFRGSIKMQRTKISWLAGWLAATALCAPIAARGENEKSTCQVLSIVKTPEGKPFGFSMSKDASTTLSTYELDPLSEKDALAQMEAQAEFINWVHDTAIPTQIEFDTRKLEWLASTSFPIAKRAQRDEIAARLDHEWDRLAALTSAERVEVDYTCRSRQGIVLSGVLGELRKDADGKFAPARRAGGSGPPSAAASAAQAKP